MMFYQALQLKEEIQKQRQELSYLISQKGFENPNLIALSQKLDIKVIELQKNRIKI